MWPRVTRQRAAGARASSPARRGTPPTTSAQRHERQPHPPSLAERRAQLGHVHAQELVLGLELAPSRTTSPRESGAACRPRWTRSRAAAPRRRRAARAPRPGAAARRPSSARSRARQQLRLLLDAVVLAARTTRARASRRVGLGERLIDDRRVDGQRHDAEAAAARRAARRSDRSRRARCTSNACGQAQPRLVALAPRRRRRGAGAAAPPGDGSVERAGSPARSASAS